MFENWRASLPRPTNTQQLVCRVWNLLQSSPSWICLGVRIPLFSASYCQTQHAGHVRIGRAWNGEFQFPFVSLAPNTLQFLVLDWLGGEIAWKSVHRAYSPQPNGQLDCSLKFPLVRNPPLPEWRKSTVLVSGNRRWKDGAFAHIVLAGTLEWVRNAPSPSLAVQYGSSKQTETLRGVRNWGRLVNSTHGGRPHAHVRNGESLFWTLSEQRSVCEVCDSPSHRDWSDHLINFGKSTVTIL